MIAFIDEHRPVYGSSRSAMCCRRSVDFLRTCRPAARPHALAGPRAAGRDPAIRNPSGLGGEFPGLRRAQGLAAARPGRDRGGALHDRPADATDGAVGRDPRQSNKDDDRQSRRILAISLLCCAALLLSVMPASAAALGVTEGCSFTTTTRAECTIPVLSAEFNSEVHYVTVQCNSTGVCF